MKKNKLRYLLLAPILLSLFIQSCTNSKTNQEGQNSTDTNKEIVAKNSAGTEQQSSPDGSAPQSSPSATEKPSSTDLAKPPSFPELGQSPSGTDLTQLPSGTDLTQSPSSPLLTKQPSPPVQTKQPSPPVLTKQPSPPVLTQQPSPTKTNAVPGDSTSYSMEAQPSNYTEAARFLAGMKVEGTSPLVKSEKEKSWQSHASFFDYAWKKLENQQLAKVRKWSSTELAALNDSSAPIFYPFSGPDFLYVYSFFPKASEYVLVGLEPVGEIPSFDKIAKSSEIGTNLRWLESSMADVMQLSFFKTKNMAKDFRESKLKGVLPILLVFLARTNNTIQDVQYIELNKDGTVQTLNNVQKGIGGKKAVSGVKIDFVPPGEYTSRSLYYFSTDLSNEGLKKTPEFNTFVQSLPQPITYLKAASYLMYQNGFSNIRNLILSQSGSLLQDDSGMPVKYFDRSKWNFKFYGTYTGPIGLFKNSYQSDLRKIYQTDKTVKPLDFGIGYQYRVNHSNLMLATSK